MKYKQLFDDPTVRAVRAAFYKPGEYLLLPAFDGNGKRGDIAHLVHVDKHGRWSCDTIAARDLLDDDHNQWEAAPAAGLDPTPPAHPASHEQPGAKRARYH